MAVRALPAVRSIETEADERGSDIVARFDCGRAVASVIAEQVALVRDVVLLAEGQHAPGQVVVEWTGHVRHGDGHPEFPRALPRRYGSVVNGHHFGHVAMKDRGSAGTHFLGDGK